MFLKYAKHFLVHFLWAVDAWNKKNKQKMEKWDYF